MDSLKKVLIDETGVFKYIQIMHSPSEQLLIWGWWDCEYHPDILWRFIGMTELF